MIVFGHRNVEITWNALYALELQVGPLPVIDESSECLLQILKNAGIRTLYLVVVDMDTRIQFLAVYRRIDASSQEKTEYEEGYKLLHLSKNQCANRSYFLLNSRKRIRVSTCFVLLVKSLDSIQL